MKNKKSEKTLVIVESPAKIKKISSFLGEDYIVRASFGHIMDLSTGDKIFNLGVDIENDFAPKYVIIPDKRDKVQSIIDAASGVDQIFLASDPDREGEAIAWHLLNCLESTGKPIKRIVFNEITKAAVTKAVSNPGPLDKNLYDAQQARRVVDRIVGFMSSSFLRKSTGQSLSSGRVQSVAAKLIIDKESSIKSFIPDEYWVIGGSFSNGNEEFHAKIVDKVVDETRAKSIKTDLSGDTFVVKSIDAQEKKRLPPPPLTTSTLQQAAGSVLGMKVVSTMKCAQSLYESGLITYMRTDSVRMSPESVTAARDYLVKKGFDIPSSPNVYATNGSAQDAHEAIRPTDIEKLPESVFISDDQQKVYKLIWERFMSAQMNPALYDTMTVDIKSSSGHLLKATGKALKEEGWLVISKDQKKENGSSDKILPNLSVGDVLNCKNPNVEQKFTQPPTRFTEVSLVKELEKRGIGRPSTYANIIETIKSRGYVEMKANQYHATDIGVRIIDKLTEHFKFMNYNYTAKMEKNLDKIAEGNLEYVAMLDEFFIPFQKECKDAQFADVKDYGIKCPTCNEKTILKHGRFGYYMCCIDYPNCKGSVSVDVVDDEPIIKELFKKDTVDGVVCPVCSGTMHKVDGKFGPFFSCENFPKCNGKRKVPFGKICPECRGDLFLSVYKGVKKLMCMSYPKCYHQEDLPDDSKGIWKDPSTIIIPKNEKSVDKVLKSSRKGIENK